MKFREIQRRARFLDFEIFESQGKLVSLMYTFHYTHCPTGGEPVCS